MRLHYTFPIKSCISSKVESKGFRSSIPFRFCVSKAMCKNKFFLRPKQGEKQCFSAVETIPIVQGHLHIKEKIL